MRAWKKRYCQSRRRWKSSIPTAAYKNLARKRYDGYHVFAVKMGWTPVTELAKAMGDKKKVREVFAKSHAAFHEGELDEGRVH